MRRDLVTSLLAVLLLTVVFGVIYPLVMTGAAQVIFPGESGGSLVKRDGKVVGSTLIGQDFRGLPRYFQGRPSTATKYAADATAFTNLGPNSSTARDTFKANLDAYLKRERPFFPTLIPGQVPVDAVTSSASGIDPHISQANADIQAHRIAALRHLSLGRVHDLISANTDGRSLGFFGEAGVNVLELNLALDRIAR
jgi:potassium-transporting ATPase KdpC subunit